MIAVGVGFTGNSAFAISSNEANGTFVEVKGQVRSGGVGIPGVCVSDGQRIYRTDSKGRFGFLKNRHYVFLYTH